MSGGQRRRRAEAIALALLGLSTVSAVAFVVVYATDSLPAQTQLLGLSLGLSLLALAAALIDVGRELVPDREEVEAYPAGEHPGEQAAVLETIGEADALFTRPRLFKLALAGTGGALGLAFLAPALSLGRFLDTRAFRTTPWRGGRRLVDESGRPWRADAIEEKNFYTAFPEGADRSGLAAPVVLVRLPLRELRLPEHLRGYDARGIVAYSKICTHAGCAVTLYRSPQFAPTDPRPALVCPCHYSTFDPAAGGTVLFGPAGRPLPMLPVRVDGRGYLRAKGPFSGQVGPAWWGTRIWRSTS
jgi:quinol---cytochrome c reductase iron-sulfur subunit